MIFSYNFELRLHKNLQGNIKFHYTFPFPLHYTSFCKQDTGIGQFTTTSILQIILSFVSLYETNAF